MTPPYAHELTAQQTAICISKGTARLAVPLLSEEKQNAYAYSIDSSSCMVRAVKVALEGSSHRAPNSAPTMP